MKNAPKAKWLVVFLCLLQFVTFCREAKQKSFAVEKEKVRQSLQQNPARNFSSYTFKKDASIISRLNHRSDLVLKFLREFDERPDYMVREVNADQQKRITKALADLPKYLKTVLQDALVGFYFIDGFASSGYNEWILDQNSGKIYVFIAFAGEVLNNDAGRQLSKRDNSAFKKGRFEISVEFQPALASLDYLFLHEAAHTFDYLNGVNTYVDEDHKYFVRPNPTINRKFMSDYWVSRKEAKKANRLSYAKRLKFYGFGKGPLLENNELPAAYKALESKIYPSIYASSSWAEDFAELVTIYHLTKKRNIQYHVNILDGGKKINSYDLSQVAKLQPRFNSLKQFYH